MAPMMAPGAGRAVSRVARGASGAGARAARPARPRGREAGRRSRRPPRHATEDRAHAPSAEAPGDTPAGRDRHAPAGRGRAGDGERGARALGVGQEARHDAPRARTARAARRTPEARHTATPERRPATRAPGDGARPAATASPVNCRATSRTVARRASSVLAVRVRPGTRPSRVGATGLGCSRRSVVQAGWGWPAKKAATAPRAHVPGSLPRVEWPVNGTATTAAPGMRPATARALSSGVRRSSAPSSRSVGTAGSGPGEAGAGAAFGQPRHVPTAPPSSRDVAGERAERGAPEPPRRGHRRSRAPLGAGRAAPREARLLAQRGRVQRVARRVAAGALQPARGDPADARGAGPQAHERAQVAGQRAAHGAGQVGAQGRVLVAGEEDVEQRQRRDAHAHAAPARVRQRAADAAAVDAADERAQVAHGIARDAAAGAAVAQRAQHPRHRVQGRAQQRVPALGRDDRVEHERLDAVGVGRRVVQRDLRAVGDAEQHEPLVARLAAQVLEVGDRVGRRVEGAPRAELLGAAADRARLRGRARLERRTAQPARPPVPALVEDEQVAGRERGRHDLREVGRSSGSAAWPGPPARATTAVAVGLEAARTRLACSVTVPARPSAAAIQRDRRGRRTRSRRARTARTRSPHGPWRRATAAAAAARAARSQATQAARATHRGPR